MGLIRIRRLMSRYFDLVLLLIVDLIGPAIHRRRVEWLLGRFFVFRSLPPCCGSCLPCLYVLSCLPCVSVGVCVSPRFVSAPPRAMSWVTDRPVLVFRVICLVVLDWFVNRLVWLVVERSID